MNTTVPWSMEGVADDTRAAALDAARRSGQSLGDWLDAVIAERGAPMRGTARPDHTAEMEAIAAQLAQLSESGDGSRAPARTGAERFDARAAIRDAVAEIARRQADLDRHGEAPPPEPQTAPAMPRRIETPRREAVDGPAPRPIPPGSPVEGARPATGLRRAGIDLSAEVSQTFARFSRDLNDAIQATDARPKVEALDRQMRHIGRTIEGIGASLPDSDAIARIGEQTREMRDLLKAASGRAAPLDAVERQVASLEARLGRLGPGATPAPLTPDFADTMAEVRALLGGLQPGAALGPLETRVDEITDRIARGLDARGPAGLIEGLSRRVDEIHASLRSQLAESAVDTRPLEGLVRGLSDRLGQAREASADFQQLEVAMRDVAAKIESATAGVDPRGVQAVEVQLARLAERLDRSETSLKALDGVEHSLGELFSQFEVTRQVAIDAAETAARTAARDTLRAALQNPSLAQRPSEAPSALADQVTRGLDDLRALQDMAERRTQTALSDIQATMERLAQGMALPAQARTPTPEPRRRRGVPEAAAAAASHVAIDPSDMLIEPGSGRDGAPDLSARAEPRFPPEPEAAPVPEGDGPASFIAAARRAAQAAQASVASTAAQKAAERRPASHGAGRARRAEGSSAAGTGTLARARHLLVQRRRPILLGLAALVLLVGALEVVKLSVQPVDATRIGAAEIAAPRPARTAGPPPAEIEARAAIAAAPVTGSVAPAAPSPAVAAAHPPLPTFLGGIAKPQVPADGLGEGLLGLASSGDAAAQYEAGGRYADGRGVTRDSKQALAWLQKAAAQGLAPAEYRLGSAYEKGVGADRDPALAMAWYAKAADAGNVRAMYNLAVMSAEGAAGKPDYAKAAQWFNKASGFGVRDAEFNLAILYARGLGIEQSLSQSYTWFAVAASQGDADAAKKRDEVAAQLDPKVLASAKAAADAFHAATPLAAANEVTSPPGGWDAAVAPRGPGASSAAGSKVSQL